MNYAQRQLKKRTAKRAKARSARSFKANTYLKTKKPSVRVYNRSRGRKAIQRNSFSRKANGLWKYVKSVAEHVTDD